MKILITGCAGFIGFHLCQNLLMNTKNKIYGLDNLNDYYDINLKNDRLKILKKNYNNFRFYKIDIANKKNVAKNFYSNKYDIVINLAAQAGVRYSVENPDEYVRSNLVGFFNILDISQKINVKHMLFASTSSVYGKSKVFPLKEDFKSDEPLSFYAATKKSNEVMAYSYSNIHNIPITCLRFFTVYGPYGRPDMSLFKFSKSIIEKKNIELYNYGKHIRDFTYIDDVVDSIRKLIPKIPKKKIPYEVFNISHSKPKTLKYFLSTIEKTIGKKTNVLYKPLQLGDTFKTHANNKKLIRAVGNINKTKIEDGISKFIKWYNDYYKK